MNVDVKERQAQKPRIVFFGDSICYGQLVPPHLTWVTRIAARVYDLGRLAGLPRVLVANASINGNTTRLALERMPYDVQSHGVDLCIVQFGLNDCNQWQTDRGLPRVSGAAFAANLREIADRARTFGASRVILNTNHPTTRSIEPLPGGVTFEQQNRRYNAIIRDVAAVAPGWIQLHDLEAIWHAHLARTGRPLADLLLDDGLHLSEAGHELYFDSTWPVVEAAFRAVAVRGQEG